jgi:hypothetical protein
MSKMEEKGDALTPQFSAAILGENAIGYRSNVRLGSTSFNAKCYTYRVALWM